MQFLYSSCSYVQFQDSKAPGTGITTQRLTIGWFVGRSPHFPHEILIAYTCWMREVIYNMVNMVMNIVDSQSKKDP